MARPQKYTDVFLKGKIIEIKVQYNYQKITPTILEKETGIERTVWIKRMKDFLEEINKPSNISIEFDNSFNVLPNIGEVVMSNIDNKKKLLEILDSYTMLMHKLWEKASMTEGVLKQIEDLKMTIHKLEERNKHLEEEKKYYETQYLNATVSSTNITQRREQGLKNVLDLKKAKNKQLLDEINNLEIFNED